MIILHIKFDKLYIRNWVFLQTQIFKPDGASLGKIKIKLFDLTEFLVWRYTLGCKEKGIRKLEIVAKK